MSDIMAQTVEQALKGAKLYTDSKSYILVRLHPGAIVLAASVMAELAEPFSALVVDKDELTLLIPADSLPAFAPRFRDYRVSDAQYRLITFDVALDLALVGFLARVSQALADAGVSIVGFGSYSRDHVLVPTEQFDAAWATLEKLTTGN
jgi:hypothetical protein